MQVRHWRRAHGILVRLGELARGSRNRPESRQKRKNVFSITFALAQASDNAVRQGEPTSAYEP